MITGQSRTAVKKILDVCQAAANGDFEARITGIEEKGDLGELMHAINLLIDRTDAYLRESKACLECVNKNQYYRLIAENGMVGSFYRSAETINRATFLIRERNERFGDIADRFEARMGDIVDSMTGAVSELGTVSDTVMTTSELARERAASASAGADVASENMQGVACAAEELTSAIAEITQQVNHAAETTAVAVKKSDLMSAEIGGLSEASQRIGEVVSMISEIAEQTNLLALNATIEAARAGDAGKGFAVVASEVKALACQTAKATDEVAAQIGDVQGATESAVAANRDIGKTISSVNQIATTIVNAIEEQSAATTEISRNVEQAASGTHDVSAGINAVALAADETTEAVGHVAGASRSLAAQSEVLQSLRSELQTFIAELKRTG